MKKLIILSILAILLASCSGDFFSYQTNRPGVGRVNVQKHVYGKEANCATYSQTTYTSSYLKRKQHFYRPRR